jgi:zinc protease
MKTLRAVIATVVMSGVALPQEAPPPAQKKTPAPKTAAAKPAAARPGIPASYKDLKFPAMNPIKVPPVAKHTLPNGITLFLVEDKELPLIRAQAVIRTGDRYEPVEKAGVADITLRVMRTGGTPSRNGDALDKELDRLAASVETGAGGDSSNASMFVLKKDIDHGLTILADILQSPAFPEDKIELAKIDIRDGISRRNDDPDSIHGREMGKLVYGKNSPYAHHPEYASLGAISRADLIAFHKQYFQPENVLLAVWGEFDAAEMKAKVEKAFGNWAKGGKPKPGVPPMSSDAGKPGLYLIDKEDLTQSTLGIAFPLGRRDDPDYHALVVMTSVLGGGFGSRMMNQIRSVEGLAYAAYAHYAVAYDHPGYWFANVGTKSETTIKALELMRREIAKMKQAEVTDAELARAKDNILKGEAFDFDSTGKIVGRLMTYDYYGYPSDFLQKYRAGIDRVTKADVLRVAQKYLDESKFQTLVLGKQAAFEKPLSSMGAVTPIDITIPQPKSAETPTATAETTEKAKALLGKVREAHGGAALGKVKDYASSGEAKMQTPQGEMAMKVEASVSLAGKGLVKMTAPFGEILQGFDGKVAWIKTPQGVQEMAPMVAQFKNNSYRDTVRLLSEYDKGAYEVQALGESKLDGKSVEGIAVKVPAEKIEFRIFIDPATNLIAGKQYMGSGGLGGPPAEMTEIVHEYRNVDGIRWAARTTVMNGSQKQAEVTTAETKLNPGLPDSMFSKPQQ